jgi:hypothetical protein
MSRGGSHVSGIPSVPPSALGCEEMPMAAQFVTAVRKSWAHALYLDRHRMAGLLPAQRLRVAIPDPGS